MSRLPNSGARPAHVAPIAPPGSRLRLRPVVVAVHLATAGLMLAAGSWAPHAQAQTPAEQARRFDIPAGSLTSALNRFAETAGVFLSAPAELTQGKTSPGLSGNFTVERGFFELLRGQGLQVVRQPNGSYVLRQGPATPAANDTTLPLVQVTAGLLTDADKIRLPSSSAALFADTPLIEVPFSVSVYNQLLIEDQRAFTLKEVLQNDSSVSVQMPGGYYGVQNFGLRGFRVDNFNGYRLDGLPIINTVASSIDDKARVEMLKGPAALRFGFMPPGGAINLVRKRPTQDFSTTLQFDVDTFGSFYGQVDVSDTVGTFGYRAVFAADSYDSFYNHADGDRKLGSLYAEWKPTQGTTLWGSIARQDLERSGYYGPMITANGEILDTGVKTNIMQDWARNLHRTFDASIGADVVLNRNWKLRASYNFQDTGRDSVLTYPYSVADNGDFTDGALITNGDFEWKTSGGQVHFEGGFATGRVRHDVVVGVQYNAYESTGLRQFPDVGPNNAYNLVSLPIPAVRPWGESAIFKYKETGFFLTDTIAFSEQWSALLGTRYGKYENSYSDDPASDDRVSAWTPTVALMYAPAKNVHTYVTYTRGMQDGGFADRTAANAWEPLGVQKSEQWEGGVKGEWMGGRVSGEAAIFQIEQDLATQDGNGVAGFNGLQRHRGFEFALRGFVTDSLQAGVSAMVLDAKQVDTGDPAKDGKRPQYVPDHQVNLWADWAVPAVPGLSLNANARFVDGQYLDQAEGFAIDRYWVLDVGARYRFKAKGNEWTLRLNIDNVLDKRYYESGEFYAGDAGYLGYGAPVSANFSVSVRF